LTSGFVCVHIAALQEKAYFLAFNRNIVLENIFMSSRFKYYFLICQKQNILN